MPKYTRPKVTGASIFFTVALQDRDADTLVTQIDVLRAAVQSTRRERPFAVNAWVVLPDHMHCIWTLPAGDSDFPTRWRLIKARFSMAIPRKQVRRSHAVRRERGIWQRRYWEHHIRSVVDHERHVHYCWVNPAKHGLVTDPKDWPFSSFRNMRQKT